MKPNYYTIADVPQTVIDSTVNELNDLATTEIKERAIQKMFEREVMLE